jgi:predicted O-linked N-acetylglucosamine transferase (SPINDLY family)
MKHLERALSALKAGDHQQALGEIEAHLSAWPASGPDAAWLTAECLMGLGQYAEGLEQFALALDDPAYQTPERFVQAGRHALAAAHLEAALLFGLKAKRLAFEDAEVNFFLLEIIEAGGDRDLLEHVVPPLLKAARTEHLNRLITIIGPDRSSPHSLDLFKRLAELYPERTEYLVTAYVLAREFCDYDYIADMQRRHPPEEWAAREDLIGAETPLDNLYWCGDEAMNRLARSYPGGAPDLPVTDERRRLRLKPAGEKLHIGYLSADFLPEHATMLLLGDVLRHHDRQRFDITLFCHTVPAHVAGQPRPHGWGRIVDINGLDDREAAHRIRAEGVDILVDLKGHTAHTRCNILNHGAAPLQATWLGFPGSVTGVDLDYVISDRTVTPDASAAHYGERFCRLPHTYQPNDPTRPDPPALPRAELGLPEGAVVMACFNTPRKISIGVIELWAKILKAAPNTVLWLLFTDNRLVMNIRRWIHGQGVDPRRVLFAPGLPQARHLARLKAADFALDTFPYNGHTTTSDALWAGVPVVALSGTNFASRVSESLLNAIGLPELVAPDAEGYVALAAGLAGDPVRLSAIRRKLAGNRLTTPLYDSRRFARDLERAYRMMHARALSGSPPASFDVPPSDDR